MGKYIIELDDDIVKGIRGENDCEVEPREIVRSFQATIADAIKNATPYRSTEDADLLKRIEDIQEASAKLDRRLNALISCLYPTCLSKDDVGFIDSQELADNEDK